MKNTLVLFVLLFLIGTKGFAQTAVTDSIQVLSIPQFEKMAAKKKSKIIDVRTPEEVAEGHLAGASTVNFLSPDFTSQVAGLNKKGTYLLNCRSGSRTRKAADDAKNGIQKCIHAGRRHHSLERCRKSS